jgi:hypothetical protein
MSNCTTHFACDCITEKVIKLEKEILALKDKLAEEKAKSQKLVEALEKYANHESVIKEAYHTTAVGQIAVVHTFINLVAEEALKEYRGEK